MGSATLEMEVERNYSGLEPAGHAIITREQRELLRRLDSFEAPYLEEKLLTEGVFDNSGEYQEAFTEFKKYVALSFISDNGLAGMMSKKVDNVWHQFILFTREYAGFCENILGKFLHHSPHTGQTSKDLKRKTAMNFVRSYNEVFGDVPEIWGIRGDEGLAPYLNSSHASGECTIGCSGSKCSGSKCAGTMCY